MTPTTTHNPDAVLLVDHGVSLKLAVLEPSFLDDGTFRFTLGLYDPNGTPLLYSYGWRILPLDHKYGGIIQPPARKASTGWKPVLDFKNEDFKNRVQKLAVALMTSYENEVEVKAAK